MKFSIRDLLWLTLLAGVLVTWWIDRSSLSRELEEMRFEIDFLRRDRSAADAVERYREQAKPLDLSIR